MTDFIADQLTAILAACEAERERLNAELRAASGNPAATAFVNYEHALGYALLHEVKLRGGQVVFSAPLAQLLNPQFLQPKEKSAMSHQDPYTHADLNGTLDRDETVSLERLAATVAALLPKESKKEQRTEPGGRGGGETGSADHGFGFTRPPAKPAPKKK